MSSTQTSAALAADTVASAGSALVTAPDRLGQALARLSASRASLRAEMIPAVPTVHPGAGDAAGGHGGLPWRRWWRSLRQALPDGPVTELVASLAQDWWRRHPWRPVGDLLAREARGQWQPFVRRHPLTVVLGAAALGAGAVALLQWRWRDLRRPMRAAPWQAGQWLARQLAQPALQTALLLRLMAWLQRATPAPADATGPDPGAGTAAGSSGPGHGG